MRRTTKTGLGASLLVLMIVQFSGAAHAATPVPEPPRQARTLPNGGFGGTIMISDENNKVNGKGGTVIISDENDKTRFRQKRR